MKKESVKREKGNNSGKTKSGFNFRSVRIQLYAAFAIPIVCMIILGYVTYNQAEAALISSYEQNTLETFKASADLMASVMDNVVENAIEITVNPDLSEYLSTNSLTQTPSEMSLMVASIFSSDYINNYYVFGSKGTPIESVTNKDIDYYNDYSASEDATALKAAPATRMWTGYHKFLDDNTAVPQDEYSLTLALYYGLKDFYVLCDIKSSYIKEIVNGIDLGTGSVVGLITSDGREILSDGVSDKLINGGSVFNGLDCFGQAVAGADEYGVVPNVSIGGNNYYFLYSKVEDTGVILCSLVPQSTLVEGADAMKVTTAVLILIACVVSFLVATFITISITKAISSMRKGLDKASTGDMTVLFKTKRKDEFASLCNSLTAMTDNTKQLLVRASDVSNSVETTSNNLLDDVNSIRDSADTIAATFAQVQAGIDNQKNEIDNCTEIIADFANGITDVSASIANAKEITTTATAAIDEGVTIVGSLNDKMSATAQKTNEVIDSIETLENHTKAITEIVELINNLSEQTNLLSLNASIEAARAGAAGKGFSVVAEEIRKLAEETMNAGNNINNIIKNIQNQTAVTVALTRESGEIVSSQMSALASTCDIFDKISNQVSSLNAHFDTITRQMAHMDEKKSDTLDSIEGISAISQESSDVMVKTNEKTLEQNAGINALSKEFASLSEQITTLRESMAVFKIE